MSETRSGTVLSLKRGGQHTVVVFVGDVQITEPSRPISPDELERCRIKFSHSRSASPPQPAYVRRIFPIHDVDGFIAELGLRSIGTK